MTTNYISLTHSWLFLGCVDHLTGLHWAALHTHGLTHRFPISIVDKSNSTSIFRQSFTKIKLLYLFYLVMSYWEKSNFTTRWCQMDEMNKSNYKTSFMKKDWVNINRIPDQWLTAWWDCRPCMMSPETCLVWHQSSMSIWAGEFTI